MTTPTTLAHFHEKAVQGKPLSILFLGGSLTWGANASDPQRTSYRGRMMAYLMDRYPNTPLRFHDAAIGGSGSDLALFRLDRDVHPYRPDLVFLDFSVNDDCDAEDTHRLSTYERIVREILASGSAILPVLMAFCWHAEACNDPIPKRHQAHLKIAHAYQLPVGDIMQAVKEATRKGELDPAAIWCIENDGGHPDDPGYTFFFETVRAAYEAACIDPCPTLFPETPVYPDLYPVRSRQLLSKAPLPKGWQRGATSRIALWFDGLPSRWIDEVILAEKTTADTESPAPLEIPFRGSFVGLFGERSSTTPPFRVWIDGTPIPSNASAVAKGSEPDYLWKIDTSRFSPTKVKFGNLFAWTSLATQLPEGEHLLRLEVLFENALPGSQFRIESLCSAGR